jgi:ubiquinone/menaquinone biosynthesis C-methylase UbiE
MKLALGCWKRNYGKDWTHVDLANLPHIDIKSNVKSLPMVPTESCELVYASHVLEYFDRTQVLKVLTEWHRVLKPGGVLRLGVPDFEAMAKLYVDGKCKLSNILGPLYGKMSMGNKTIYHKTTYDFVELESILESLTFKGVTRYDWRDTEHAGMDDHSQAYLPHMDKENGILISLNIEATK